VKPRVYIETTVVSYYTGRPSRDLVTAAHQQLTRDWWEERLPILGGCISELVLTEASQGDKQAARLRMDALEKLPILARIFHRKECTTAGKRANLLV
jgi:hypothetical protein